MKSSIRWRLVMMYVLLVIIIMMISGTMIVLQIKNNEQAVLENEMVIAAKNIKGILSQEVEDIEQLNQELKTVFKNNVGIYSNKRVLILDTNAKVVFSSKATELGLSFPTHQVMAAIEDGAYTAFDYRQRLLDSKASYIGYAESIKHKGQVIYVIYILGDTTTIDQNIQATITVIFFTIIVALLIAVVLGYIFAKFITKPITELSVKVRDMQRGRLDRPIRVYSKDEIGQLSINFNKMSQSLNDTLNEITREKNKLEIVFKHMTDGILVFDKMGIMVHTNPAARDMMQINGEISFGEIFSTYIDTTYIQMKEAVFEETVSRIILVEEKYYSIYFAKFLDQREEAAGLICVIQDITEHKKLEEMQKEFVANVSHELRTPLTTIKSYAETLLEGAWEDEVLAKKFLKVINYEGDRMTALVQDLLELSKLDNSQVKFSLKTINLKHLLEDGVEKYSIHARKKQQTMVYNPPNFSCMVVGDVGRTEQVFRNIIANAIKYSPEGARIEIEVVEETKYIKVIIRDNGLGIPKEDLERIFDRFYRVNKARSRAMGGTGLGLAIAKEIMAYQGGKIEVASILGKGTHFDVYFPKEIFR